ncbi:MAG TPA: L-seryl-tRNA(Sec) selenium transferase, partial [Gemmatimonadaceae bacterium]
MSDARRKLPSVSALLEQEGVRALLERAPRSIVVDAVRSTIDVARNGSPPRSDAEWVALITKALGAAQRASLRPVINATGVVLHTNLGRAPLAEGALAAINRTASGYTNLEYDIERGARGSRYDHCGTLLCELTGAGGALVVNNGAAALVLALNTLANDRDAVVSRGELVEIGGSFRIPDIMARSGARLVEVGATNRTHNTDYAGAIHEKTGALLKVHRSNFSQEGFVAEVDAHDLAALGRERGVPLVHDLGSGLLIPLDSIGLKGEPTAADAVRAGSSVVTMSADKLLGGPQAGIIIGDAKLLNRMRENPLLRALRVDKLTLAALEATLTLYREPARALAEIPVLRMLGTAPSALRARAQALRSQVHGVDIIETDASVGGGAFPKARIASIALAVSRDAKGTEERLRLGEPAVIGRIADDRLLLDLRTVSPGDD